MDLKGPGGVAAIGVAQVRRDAAIFSLELLDRVKGIALLEAGDRRVQSATGDEQQRETGTGLLIIDLDRTFFVDGHANSYFPSMLSKRARRYTEIAWVWSSTKQRVTHP